MLWVRNLSVMELGALFSKTGIFLSIVLGTYVLFCVCVSLFYHEYCDCGPKCRP